MEPSRDHERQISRVVDAANRLEGAKRGLRAAVLDAVEAGVPQTHVAEAAEIGRMTLWRWLQGEGREW